MPELETDLADEVKVRAWRFERLFSKGFTTGEARRLSEAGVDHHEAEALLNAGCPTSLAYRILRGLEPWN